MSEANDLHNIEILKNIVIWNGVVDFLNRFLEVKHGETHRFSGVDELVDAAKADDEAGAKIKESIKTLSTALWDARMSLISMKPYTSLDAEEKRMWKRSSEFIVDLGKIRERAGIGIKKPDDGEPEIDPAIHDEAVKILASGKVIDHFLQTWHQDYVGADFYGLSLLFSMFCGTCDNTRGLNPEADGESSSGKTWAQKAMSGLNHPTLKIAGLITPRAGFYNEIKRGSTLQLDDVGKMTPEIAQLYKVSCSWYQEGADLLTVSTEREGQRLKFPKCLNMWLTGVEVSSFNNQIRNRNVSIPLDEANAVLNRAHKEKIRQLGLDDGVTGRIANGVTHDVEVCQEMSKILIEAEQVNVIIPWLQDEAGPILDWQDIDNPRTLIQFEDMVRVCASINRFVRPERNGHVVATLDDYDYVVRVWQRIGRQQISKLNARDERIKAAMVDLKAYGDRWIDLYELSDRLGEKYTTVRRWVVGDKNSGVEGFIDRAKNVRIMEEHEMEYDVAIEETAYGGERTKKVGSKGRQRFRMQFRGKNNALEFSGASCLDRERASKRLEAFLASP